VLVLHLSTMITIQVITVQASQSSSITPVRFWTGKSSCTYVQHRNTIDRFDINWQIIFSVFSDTGRCCWRRGETVKFTKSTGIRQEVEWLVGSYQPFMALRRWSAGSGWYLSFALPHTRINYGTWIYSISRSNSHRESSQKNPWGSTIWMGGRPP
jgi:hypothetical protein